LKIRPSRFREMLNSKRLWDILDLQEDLEVSLTRHAMASNVNDMRRRLVDLVKSDKEEIARKAATTLLNEGIKNYDQLER